MNDALMMFGFTSLIGFLSTVFWYWVKALSKASEQLAEKCDSLKDDLYKTQTNVFRDYQSKDDAHKDMRLIIDMLKDIKTEVVTVRGLVDSKADK